MTKFAPIGFNLDHQSHSCTPEQTLAEVAHAMWKYACSWMPVVSAGEVVVGVVTNTDIRLATLNRGARLEERVSTIMTRFVVPVRSGQILEDVEKLMQWSPLRRFPVLDEAGRLRGLVSFTDYEPVESITILSERSAERLSERRPAMASGIAPTLPSFLGTPQHAKPDEDGPIAA